MTDFEWSKDPAWQAGYLKLTQKLERIERLLGWTRRVPLVGSVVWVFWSNWLDEGLWATVKPRWGALTFSFLNDGMKPTVWHTWRSITHDNTDEFTGIYVTGAPHSLREAIEWRNLPIALWKHNH